MVFHVLGDAIANVSVSGNKYEVTDTRVLDVSCT